MKKLKRHKQKIEEQIRQVENKTSSSSKIDQGKEALTESIKENWSAIIRSGDTVARNYLHHLIDRIEVDENEITVIPKEEFMTRS